MAGEETRSQGAGGGPVSSRLDGADSRFQYFYWMRRVSPGNLGEIAGLKSSVASLVAEKLSVDLAACGTWRSLWRWEFGIPRASSRR